MISATGMRTNQKIFSKEVGFENWKVGKGSCLEEKNGDVLSVQECFVPILSCALQSILGFGPKKML